MLITTADVPPKPHEAVKEPNVPTAEFKVCVNTPKEDRAPRLRLQSESSDSDRKLLLFEMQSGIREALRQQFGVFTVFIPTAQMKRLLVV